MGRYSTSLDVGKDLEKEDFSPPPMNPSPPNEEQKTLDEVHAKTGEERAAEELEEELKEQKAEAQEKAKDEIEELEETLEEEEPKDDKPDDEEPDADEAEDPSEEENDVNDIIENNNHKPKKATSAKMPLWQIGLAIIIILAAGFLTWKYTMQGSAELDAAATVDAPQSEMVLTNAEPVPIFDENEAVSEQPEAATNETPPNADDALAKLAEELKD